MRVLIIDNYDSFTYNLYQYVGECLSCCSNSDVTVLRNDAAAIQNIKTQDVDRIIISPGPGSPDDPRYFGYCEDVITRLGPETPLLGVCLGMQGIAHCFGGRIIRAATPMHGKTSRIIHDDLGIYQGVPQQLDIMRYHSLIIEAQTLPPCFQITSSIIESTDHNGNSPTSLVKQGAEIMGIRHKQYPIEGIQYHLESFATEGGQRLLANFLFQTPN